MDYVNFAAQVFLGAAAAKLIISLRDGRKKRIEALAAQYEFGDDRTSRERKQQLLMRYPQTLIAEPRREYWDMAHEEVTAEKQACKSEWPRVADYMLGLFFLAVLGFGGFACLSVVMSWLNHESAWMASQDAWLLVCSYSLDHVWNVIFWVCFWWYFMATAAKLITEKRAD